MLIYDIMLYNTFSSSVYVFYLMLPKKLENYNHNSLLGSKKVPVTPVPTTGYVIDTTM